MKLFNKYFVFSLLGLLGIAGAAHAESEISLRSSTYVRTQGSLVAEVRVLASRVDPADQIQLLIVPRLPSVGNTLGDHPAEGRALGTISSSGKLRAALPSAPALYRVAVVVHSSEGVVKKVLAFKKKLKIRAHSSSGREISAALYAAVQK